MKHLIFQFFFNHIQRSNLIKKKLDYKLNFFIKQNCYEIKSSRVFKLL